MNSSENIHEIFSNVMDKWSENFKKDMDPLLKIVDNIHMKNIIINEILKSMPEYKLLEESNKKLIIENLELKNKLQNNIILSEDSKELELCISDYELLEANNNIDYLENPDNIIINDSQDEDKKNVTEDTKHEIKDESEAEINDESEAEINDESEAESEDDSETEKNSKDEKIEAEGEDEESEGEEKEDEGEDQEDEGEDQEDEGENQEDEEDEGEEEEVEKAEGKEKEDEEDEEEDEEDEEDKEEEDEAEEENDEDEEEDEEEVFLVEIQGKNYYTDSEKNGTIYICLDDEDIGDKVGFFDKNGVAIFD